MGAMERRKIFIPLPSPGHCNTAGEEIIYHRRQSVHRNRAAGKEIYDLTPGMDACVGTAGGGKLDQLAADSFQSLLQDILNRRYRRHLPLKAVIIGSVVGHPEPYIAAPSLHHDLMLPLHDCFKKKLAPITAPKNITERATAP